MRLHAAAVGLCAIQNLIERERADRCLAGNRRQAKREGEPAATASAGLALSTAAGALLPPHLAAATGPPRIVLRRRAATGGDVGAHIIFHRDSAPAVVNVALNDSFTGGDLLYAVGGRLERPMRAAGVATAHDGATVHGVTALSSGVRYTLLVAFH